MSFPFRWPVEKKRLWDNRGYEKRLPFVVYRQPMEPSKKPSRRSSSWATLQNCIPGNQNRCAAQKWIIFTNGRILEHGNRPWSRSEGREKCNDVSTKTVGEFYFNWIISVRIISELLSEDTMLWIHVCSRQCHTVMCRLYRSQPFYRT